MTIDEMQEEVSDCIDRIKACFKPGVKVMVLVRAENDPEGARVLLMGDDEPQEAMNLIARRMAAAALQ